MRSASTGSSPLLIRSGVTSDGRDAVAWVLTRQTKRGTDALSGLEPESGFRHRRDGRDCRPRPAGAGGRTGGRSAGCRPAALELGEGDAALPGGLAAAARAELLGPLGVKPAEVRLGEHPMGTRIEADPTGATSVPGVWVAGNITDIQAHVMTSAASGLAAGAAINFDLVLADARHTADAHRHRPKAANRRRPRTNVRAANAAEPTTPAHITGHSSRLRPAGTSATGRDGPDCPPAHIDPVRVRLRSLARTLDGRWPARGKPEAGQQGFGSDCRSGFDHLRPRGGLGLRQDPHRQRDRGLLLPADGGPPGGPARRSCCHPM